MGRSIVWAAVLFLLVCGGNLHADTAPNDAARTEAQAVYDSLMSPYCPGRLLRDCPSGQASALKDKIMERAVAGEKGDQILESLIGSFGEEMRATPRPRGFGLMAWLAPAVFFFGGMTALVIWLLIRSARAGDQSSTAVDPALDRRIADELRRSERP